MSHALYTYIHFRTPSKTSTNQTPEGVHLPSDSVSRVAILPSESLSRVAILPCESVSRVAILPSENVSMVAILSSESVSRVAIYFSSISCFRACGSVSSHPPPLAQHNPERGDSFASKFRPSGIWTLRNTTKCPFLFLPSYLKKNITRIVSIFQYYKMSKSYQRDAPHRTS